MKFAIFGLVLSAALFYALAQENKDELKIYKRLIPADVLRGEFFLNGWEVTNYFVDHEYGNHVHY